MADARLTHPTRETLPLRQRQRNEDQRTAVANIAPELGTDRKPLVHTETRERRESINGQVSGPRRAADDPDTDDWQQALANYVAQLEAHVDEYQGTGYTYEDDILNVSKRAVLESVEWSLSPGALYDFNYSAEVVVGRGTFEDRLTDPESPTVDTGMSVMLRVDGIDLPGFRDYRVRKSIGLDPKAVFDRDSAENNDTIVTEGARRTVAFEGTHTGTDTERANADAALDALVASEANVTLETRFPGYTIDGFVTGHNSTQEARMGEEMTHYRIEFTEGQRA